MLSMHETHALLATASLFGRWCVCNAPFRTKTVWTVEAGGGETKTLSQTDFNSHTNKSFNLNSQQHSAWQALPFSHFVLGVLIREHVKACKLHSQCCCGTCLAYWLFKSNCKVELQLWPYKQQNAPLPCAICLSMTFKLLSIPLDKSCSESLAWWCL